MANSADDKLKLDFFSGNNNFVVDCFKAVLHFLFILYSRKFCHFISSDTRIRCLDRVTFGDCYIFRISRYLYRVRRKSAVEQAQTMQIQIIPRMRKVSSGLLLSSQTLFSNDYVSEQRRPWSDCAYDAKTHFRLVRPKILFSTLHANSLLFRKQSFIFMQMSQEKKIDKYFRKPSAETLIQHAIPSGLFYPKSLDPSISKRRNICVFLVSPCFIEIPVYNANSVDPDQTPRSAASDLGLYFLPVSLLWDARHKWVKLWLNR